MSTNHSDALTLASRTMHPEKPKGDLASVNNLKQTIVTKSLKDPKKVLAGEVCSIDIAKKYGFYDANTYYTAGYSDTKTYVEKDNGNKTARLCKQSSDGTVAYPSCTVVYGVPYEQDKIDPDKCVIGKCPPGFKKEKDKCIKPDIKNATSIPVSKMTHCDEKVSDWYMQPNYHLGNKYNTVVDQNKNSTCMKPCPPDKVPGYIEDPVDGSSAGVLTNTDIAQCYNKNEYMVGKYNGTGNFCPIAWVYRLGQTKEDIMDDLTKKISDIENKNGKNIYLDKAKEIARNQTNIIDVERKKLLENVELPTNEMLSACTKLHTTDRVKKAYAICKDIHENPESIKRLLPDKTQQDVLQQACHALFCNSQDDLVSSISPGTEALCFKKTKSIPNKDLLKNDKNIEQSQSNEIKSESAPTIKNQLNVDSGATTVKRAAITGTFIVVGIPILLIIGYVIYKIIRWIWYHIIKRFLWCYIRYTIDIVTLKGGVNSKERLRLCKFESKPQ